MEASRAAAETAARVLGGDFVRETFFYTLHAILPILLVYPFIQKELVRGMVIGGVKG